MPPAVNSGSDDLADVHRHVTGSSKVVQASVFLEQACLAVAVPTSAGERRPARRPVERMVVKRDSSRQPRGTWMRQRPACLVDPFKSRVAGIIACPLNQGYVWPTRFCLAGKADSKTKEAVLEASRLCGQRLAGSCQQKVRRRRRCSGQRRRGWLARRTSCRLQVSAALALRRVRSHARWS